MRCPSWLNFRAVFGSRSSGRHFRPTKRHARRLFFDRLEQRAMLAASVVGDFNGDGRDDIAIGAPGETINGFSGAGAVHVIYGQASAGLVSTGNQIWSQDSSGVQDFAETDDNFGAALTPGNFDGDAFDDLAIGVPRESVAGVSEAGAFHILFGSATGLKSMGNQFFTQNTSRVLDVAEFQDHFGGALAAGNFNGDESDDLAVAAVDEDLGAATSAGAVHVFFGVSFGLTEDGNQFWTQNTSGILDSAEDDDQFGFSLVTGDFDFDLNDDLVIGVPGESIDSSTSAEGAINVIYGSLIGLTSANNQFLHQDSSGVLDVAEDDDAFGASLAAGDFNDDLRDDLAIGVPLEDIGLAEDAGAVNVLYGSGTGLTSTGNQFWNQDTSGIQDVAQDNLDIFTTFGDFFGASVQSADFNGDFIDDLAIGVPGESFNEETPAEILAAGAVHVIYGTLVGLSSTGNQFWTQNITGILDETEAEDVFGLAVGAGDFNLDGRDDLVVGVPGEDIGSATDAGAINVIYGSASGLSSVGNQFLHQDSSGILNETDDDDLFGASILGGSSLTDIAAEFGFDL